jgi:hypothetical protein
VGVLQLTWVNWTAQRRNEEGVSPLHVMEQVVCRHQIRIALLKL